MKTTVDAMNEFYRIINKTVGKNVLFVSVEHKQRRIEDVQAQIIESTQLKYIIDCWHFDS